MKPMHLKEMPRKKRVLILLLSLALLLGCTLGGTYAWLFYRSGPKVVSLKGSNLEIDLAENTGSSYQMVPGETLDKDPTVTVKAGSVKSYVFVQVEDINASDYLAYSINTEFDKMTDKVKGNYTYYCYIMEATTVDVEISLLNPETVTIPTTVTKEMLNEVSNGNIVVQLNFSACAVQFANLDLDAAFELATFN